VATLGGVVLVLVASITSWREVTRLRESVNAQLGRIEMRVGQLADKLDAAVQAARPPARRGPDPERVYAIKTDGAPFRGPQNAPVTIAEFSDFQ
jgi:hypothetical protein